MLFTLEAGKTRPGKNFYFYKIFLSNAQAKWLRDTADAANKIDYRTYPSTTPGKSNQEQIISSLNTIIDCFWSRNKGRNIYMAEWKSNRPYVDIPFLENPLTTKGKLVLLNLRSEYGEKEGTSAFYASLNSGKLSPRSKYEGVH